LLSMSSTRARVKRHMGLRLNSSDWVLRLGRLSLLNFLNVAMWDLYLKC
jgi:hypothetical protein